MTVTKSKPGKKMEPSRKSSWRKFWLRLSGSWQLYLIFLLPLAYIILFKYVPMYGAQIAFRDYKVNLGIVDSPWVGWKHFLRFFESKDFFPVLKNTVIVSLYGLLAGFPVPILLAVCLNYARSTIFKKSVQMITYAPYFISTVVLVGMLMQFLAPRAGIFNTVRGLFGMAPIDFMGRPEYFRTIYVWSGVWQSAGYNAVVYLAALAAIDPSLHEAAIVDGASKLRRIWHIDLPGIMPTAVILLILNTGQLLNTGFEKILLMQNPINLRTSEVIDSYVYTVGLASQTINFSYPTAVGLFKSVISLLLLVIVNQIAKRVSDYSLW